jgi:hypothetical protein
MAVHDLDKRTRTNYGSRSCSPPGTTCAVVDCPDKGRPRVCPYDGGRHYHGAIHYEATKHPRLKFHDIDKGWFWICDKHFAVILADLGDAAL